MSEHQQIDDSGAAFEAIMAQASLLKNPSPTKTVEEILNSLVEANLSELQRETAITLVSKKSGLRKSVLKNQYDTSYLKTFGVLNNPITNLSSRVIEKHFAQGEHIRVTGNGGFESYQETHWTDLPEHKLRHHIMQEIKASGIIDGGNITATVGKSVQCIRDLLSGKASDDASSPPANIINTLTGEVHLKKDGSFELRPHSPDSNLLSCLQFAYDPVATCPKFESALDDIFANAEDSQGIIRHLMEMVGYALQPFRDIACFVVFTGTGANGKTSLLKTLEHLVPKEAVLSQSVKRFMSDNFAEASLKGKLLLIDDDIAERLLLDDALIKRISESKQITARGAYRKDKETFTSNVLPILAGNSLPRTNDVSNGMLRRAHIFPFDREFSKAEQKPKLFQDIWENELPGILNLALAGLSRLRARGNFELPIDAENALREFIIQANPLMSFIESECFFDGEARTAVKLFRVAYRAWGKEQGVGSVDASDRSLRRKLDDLGIKVGDTKGGGMIHGLALHGYNVV
ncbi:MAG: phage/plasmid primase, P4 family [Parvibaculaceae bacterium]